MARPKPTETVADIEARYAREVAAETKARDNPGELTDEDLDDLSPGTVARLAHQGHLFKFGVPAQSARARR